VTESADVVPLIPNAIPAVPMAFSDATGDFQQASRAVARIPGDEHDIAAVLQATIVCTGQSALETFEAVVAFVERSPRVEIHNIAWAKSPLGAVDGRMQYQATLTVSYQDLQGETTGVTHHRTAGS
jgi:hypothetical protein